MINKCGFVWIHRKDLFINSSAYLEPKSTISYYEGQVSGWNSFMRQKLGDKKYCDTLSL